MYILYVHKYGTFIPSAPSRAYAVLYSTYSTVRTNSTYNTHQVSIKVLAVPSIYGILFIRLSVGLVRGKAAAASLLACTDGVWH